MIVALPNRLMAAKLVDPFYWLAWPFLAALRALRPRLRPPGARFQVAMIRRYRPGSLDGLYRRSGLAPVSTSAVSFGPFTLWRREVLPLRWSVAWSDRLARLSGRRGFGFLKAVTNHWVTCLVKVR